MGHSHAVVRLVGRITKFSTTTLEAAYDREINIKLSGNSSGGHSYRQHTAYQLHVPLKLELSVALFCLTKLHILEWPLSVPPAQGAPV
jgi:hypothetical protein